MTISVSEYRLAPSGEGEYAGTWKDKPHRLVYDLCNEIERLRARAKQSFVDPAFATALVEWAGEETVKKQKAEIERLKAELDVVCRMRRVAEGHEQSLEDDNEWLRNDSTYCESRARRIVPEAPRGESFGLMMDRVEAEIKRLKGEMLKQHKGQVHIIKGQRAEIERLQSLAERVVVAYHLTQHSRLGGNLYRDCEKPFCREAHDLGLWAGDKATQPAAFLKEK